MQDLKCIMCVRSFARKDSWKRHLKSHRWPEKCRGCKQELSSSLHWMNHLPCKALSSRVTCEYCGNRFASKANLKRHTKTAFCHRVRALHTRLVEEINTKMPDMATVEDSD